MDKERGKKQFKLVSKENSGRIPVTFRHVHELLRRYFSGKAMEKEKEIVENWSLGEERPDKSRFTEKNVDRLSEDVWNKLSDKYGFESPVTQPVLRRKSQVSTLIRRYAAAAAILLLVGGSAFFLFDSGNKEGSRLIAGTEVNLTGYRTQSGEIRQVTLPDGSIVHINSGSSLSFDEKTFNKKKRELWLNEGEAFFEVAHNPEKAFVIYSGMIETVVKGTSFNIKAYAALHENVVSVRDGEVEIKSDGKLLGHFTKNKQLTLYTNTGKVETQTTGWEAAAAWMNGQITLNNAGLDELRLRIYQHFGMELQYEDNLMDGKGRLNAIFASDLSLTDMLDNICSLYGFKYTTNNTQISLSR